MWFDDGAGEEALAYRKKYRGVFGITSKIPICLATQEAEAIVEMVKRMEPTFGEINLEDISA